MTVLVDTNVILDILLKRGSYAGEARVIMTKCVGNKKKWCDRKSRKLCQM